MQSLTANNSVFVSQIFATNQKFRTTYQAFSKVLTEIGFQMGTLEKTADIWCRDYMPVPTADGRLVQFQYTPSYLKKHPSFKTNPKNVWKNMGLAIEESSIVLDGGNVLRCESRVLISERVFDENPNWSRVKLLDALEKDLQAEILIFPQIESDLTGHVDGMARFINPSTLLVNDRGKEFKYLVKKLESFAKRHQITLVDMPFFHKSIKSYPHNALGCFLNYLELPQAIVMPAFEVGGAINNQALEKLIQVFPSKKIYAVDASDLAIYGGVFNCVTWSY